MPDTGDRDYYREGSIECIDAIKAALGDEGFIAFLRGQVIKYNWRLKGKGQAHEDSIKANWYQQRLTKELEDEQQPSDDSAINHGVIGAEVGYAHEPNC
jgi:hypothetical protein